MPSLHIVLYQPEIPHNAGNVGRTCAALDAKLWLVRPLGFQLDDRRMRRAGLDYWPQLDWEAIDDWNALLDRLPEKRFWFFTKTAERLYTDVIYRPGDVLVFGGETRGLPRGLLDATPEQCARIPIRPVVRSLNLSNAVAVAAYEATRQFNSPG